ncbi:MAG: amino acid adenylation domain-containing protein [Xanthomonadales bacterium]|jgi:amino acid adenylation domain-containing protein|nr:amino acid adenylation domain-containing protein [Xanthomonadales bacterium]
MPVTLHHLALEAAERRPGGEAVRCNGEGLSWPELVRRSHGVAHALRAAGVRRGDRVAVLLAKSLDVPVAFYGVYASGGALVPIDPKAPRSQVARILNATGVRHIVTEPARQSVIEALLDDCPDVTHVLGYDGTLPGGVVTASWTDLAAEATDTPPEANVGGLDTAYIMHTSGSTGEPKLIRHTHASALAFAEWAAAEYGLTPGDRLTNHSSHHTCFATFDFYAAARAAAATVVLTPAAMMMPASLAELLEREAVSVWYSVPTALVQLLLRGNLGERDLERLRWVLFAGEVFPHKHLAALMKQWPQARFSHVYGSTEVNVCTRFHLDPDTAPPAPLPIGRPCGNARALVVDGELQPVPAGTPGELLIAGSTVMSGYWNDPERNQQALLHRPAPGGLEDTWFRTGDRVVQDDDGMLAFAGRTDLQVKIRGFRVELEEIEQALLALEPVQEAMAVAVPDGQGSSLVRAAVVCAPDGETRQKTLLDALRDTLPAYALPANIELLPALPRTATGKVDRKQLKAKYLAEDSSDV